MPIYKGSFSVFPVYAGVILKKLGGDPFKSGVPRVCGGDPENVPDFVKREECSPCMRG